MPRVLPNHEMTAAHANRGLTDPIAAIAGNPPLTFTAGVFEFDNCYVCDGIIDTPI